MTDEVQQPATGPKKKLTTEERRAVAQAAAVRRWAKVKKAAKSATKMRGAKKKSRTSKGPREFSSALKAAEKRLAIALQERDEAATKYAIKNAEIPSLVRIIAALKNPGAPAPEFAPPTLSQIISDQAIAYQNPSRVPQVPVPQQLHPANNQGRAQGGAVDVPLVEEEDEDTFLRETTPAPGGGGWH